MPVYRKSVLTFACALRRRMTYAESLLWNALRRNGLAGLHFRRQAPIAPYIADFLCARERLIVELDGRRTKSPNNKRMIAHAMHG